MSVAGVSVTEGHCLHLGSRIKLRRVTFGVAVVKRPRFGSEARSRSEKRSVGSLRSADHIISPVRSNAMGCEMDVVPWSVTKRGTSLTAMRSEDTAGSTHWRTVSGRISAIQINSPDSTLTALTRGAAVSPSMGDSVVVYQLGSPGSWPIPTSFCSWSSQAPGWSRRCSHREIQEDRSPLPVAGQDRGSRPGSLTDRLARAQTAGHQDDALPRSACCRRSWRSMRYASGPASSAGLLIATM